MDVDQVAGGADDNVDLNQIQSSSEPNRDKQMQISKPIAAISNGLAELNFDSDRLKIFYQKVFPAHLFFKWLSYNKMKTRDHNTLQSIDDKEISSNYFFHREFTFTLANDIYCRYLSFKTAEELKTALISRVPHKIDLGPVYNISPQRHLQADKKSFVPQEKEVVFDIDMDSYDDIRQCCSGAKICQRCWAFPCLAAQLITQILKEDFDIKNILWVFSGRRGVHGWVCDAEARSMNNEMRGSLVQYMSLPLGNENADKLTLSSPLHPHLKRAFKTLYPSFESIVIQDQNVLSVEKHRNRFIQFAPYEIQTDIGEKWKVELMKAQRDNKTNYGLDLWKIWLQEFNNWRATQNQHKKYTFLEALVFAYLYPRLDAHVTNSIQHLLKSPFCVHPKTGNICVPFDPNKYEDFILADVPTLTSVINELGKTSNGVLPSFEPALEIFRKHIGKCHAAEQKLLQEKEEQEMDDIVQAVQF